MADVYGPIAGYFHGGIQAGTIDLSHRSARQRCLRAWVSKVRKVVLPWFAQTGDPDLIVTSRAAEMTANPAAIVEWLASRKRTDLVPAFLDRYLKRHPQYREGMARGAALAAQGQQPELTSNQAVELGWVGARVTADSDHGETRS